MSRDRCWLGPLLGVLLALAACGDAVEAPAPRPTHPNILLVLADDLGYGDCAAYNPASRIPMPNLERLARDGMRFTDFHSPAAVCAPTRYSLATGNYPWRGRHINGVWKAHGQPQVLPGQRTLGALLKAAGYRTAKFGKHHLGGHFARRTGAGFARQPEEIDYSRPFEGGPRDMGYDTSFILPCGIQDPPYAFFRDDLLEGSPEDLRQWEAGVFGESEIRNPGVGVADWSSAAAGPRVLDEALAFLTAHQDRNAGDGTAMPFFLHYSALEAHWPWTPATELRGRSVRGVTGLGPRADLVYQFDLALGELLSALERLGLARDTLVIVTSDNGGDPDPAEAGLGHAAGGELAGRKGLIAEGGHRVPFIARWGDGSAAGSWIAPGSVSPQLASLQDLSATLAELVGAPQAVDQAVDSISFLPVLLGLEHHPPPRDHLIVQDGRGPNFALRENGWKLVLDRQGNPLELFVVDRDGREESAARSLPAADYTARSAAMAARFDALFQSARTAPPASP